MLTPDENGEIFATLPWQEISKKLNEAIAESQAAFETNDFWHAMDYASRAIAFATVLKWTPQDMANRGLDDLWLNARRELFNRMP